MRRWHFVGLLAAAAFAAVPLAAVSELAPESLQENQKRLDKWRQHPKEFAKLESAARSLAELPPERREQMLKLHRRLEQLPATTQTRLLNVLESYADWLDDLEPAIRSKIEETQDKKKRLQLIQQQREKEWLARQPRAVRTEIAGLQGDARAKRIEQVRTLERQRRREWAIASRFWEELTKKHPLPSHLVDFPPDVQNFVSEFLLPKLSEAEKARLQNAEGHWPLYPQTLVELSDAHPFSLPGPTGPRFLNDLPPNLQRKIRTRPGMPLAKQLLAAEGKPWPELARALTIYADKKRDLDLPSGLWPTNFQRLTPEVRQFVDQTFWPLLDSDEKFRLEKAVGKWPDYPETLDELARNHSLRIPWPNLPPPAARWDKYR